MVLGTVECRGVALGCVLHPRGLCSYVEAVIANPEPAGVSGVRDEVVGWGTGGAHVWGRSVTEASEKGPAPEPDLAARCRRVRSIPRCSPLRGWGCELPPGSAPGQSVLPEVARTRLQPRLGRKTQRSLFCCGGCEGICGHQRFGSCGQHVLLSALP